MNKVIEQLKLLPLSSGSYQFYDKNGIIIYIGKAENLKKRVSDYFSKSNKSEKIKVLVLIFAKIEYIIY
jgi:excinuclease ABC subunit C